MPLSKRTVSYYEAIAIMIGTIIGAGVLGLPYVIVKVGFGVGLLLMVTVGVVLGVLHLMLGEVVMRTREPLQLIGLTKLYLGRKVAAVMSFTYLVALNSSLLAYLIGEGTILKTLIGTGTPFMWSIIFFCVAFFVVACGVQMARHVEFVLMCVLLISILGVSAMGIMHSAPANLTTINLHNLFLPFGVLLFAFHGVSAIPLVEVVDPHKRDLKRVITIGSFIPFVVYVLFVLGTVGSTGAATTEVATVGLAQVLGGPALLLGSLFAVLAMGSGFVVLGTSLTQVYSWDFKIPRVVALLIAGGIPLIFFLLGLRNFITILGLMGSVVFSVESLIIIWMFLRMRSQSPKDEQGFLAHPRAWAALLAFIFVFAGGLGVWQWITA
jgi:tyrosine-specific transport protein